MELQVIKIGGNIIDNELKLASFLQTFAALPGPKILVHGGGKIATEIGRKLGIEPNYVDGRRITDKPTLDLVIMVYGGLLNKNIVAKLQAYGCNAIGLTGADGAVLPAEKRAVKSVDYGYVGDIIQQQVNTMLLQMLVEQNMAPVLAPLTLDRGGSLLNTNADTIAQAVATAMSSLMPVQLVYCFEKRGVLMDSADDNSVISSINSKSFSELVANGVINEGMIPKLENALQAVQAGVRKVMIGHADELGQLITGKAGTCIS